MKILKYIFFLILVFVIGFAIYITTLESKYDIKQTRIIRAPAEVIFNNINDFKNWQHWSPWVELDSTIVASYHDITSGVGASYSWTGKDGSGTLQTISLIPNKEIIQQIDFGTGSTAEVYWDIINAQTGNTVTWGIRGKSSFEEKIYWLTQGGIEKNMIPMYDRGLELLEQYLIKEMDKHSFDIIGEVDYGGGFYLYQSTSCKIDAVGKKREEMFPEVLKYMENNAIEASGKPFLLTHNWDELNKTTMFSTCVPVKERIITTDDVLTGFLNPQKTFKSIYKGNYKYSYEAWDAAYTTLVEHGFTQLEGGEPFEVYTVGPTDDPNPANWITEIYIPIN